MTDEKLQKKYFERIGKEVDKLKNLSKDKFQAKIDSCIQKVFEGAYIERLQTMYDKSKEA